MTPRKKGGREEKGVDHLDLPGVLGEETENDTDDQKKASFKKTKDPRGAQPA